MREIYFAGGCFWGIEEYFSRIAGTEVASGYANGQGENPTYEEVCTNTTGFAETVRVRYDAKVVSLETLARQFFKVIDPTQVNRQGNDVGTQYRTGVYYTDPDDLPVLEALFAEQRALHGGRIATELIPLQSFYLAEEYHQKYLKKHPEGYCHVDFSSLGDLKQASS